MIDPDTGEIKTNHEDRLLSFHWKAPGCNGVFLPRRFSVQAAPAAVVDPVDGPKYPGLHPPDSLKHRYPFPQQRAGDQLYLD